MAKSDVSVKIDLIKPTSTAGFGCPLILQEKASKEIAYTECTSLDEVVNAGFALDSTVYKAASLIFMQTHAPEKIAVQAITGAVTDFLGDAKNLVKEWRQLITVYDKTTGGSDAPTAAADILPVIENCDGKMYFANLPSDDTTDLTVTGLKRSVLFYCTPTEDAPVPVAALVGESAGQNAGSITYKNMILKGIQPQDLSDLEIKAIHDKGGITFVTKAGDNVTSEGKVAGGEYIDIVDSEDYIIQQLTWRTQKVLNSQPKVPYTDNGIALLEAVAVNVLQDAYNNGMIADSADGGADYSVNYAKREATSDEDRVERRYVGGTFSFTLAGAIHEVEIKGEITI